MTDDERLRIAFLVRSGVPFDRAIEMPADEREAMGRAFAALDVGHKAGVASIIVSPTGGSTVRVPETLLPAHPLRKSEGEFKNYPPVFARDTL